MKQSNQIKLKILMARHELSADDVASMLSVKPGRVRAWLYDEKAVNHRNMSDSMLKLLVMLIKHGE